MIWREGAVDPETYRLIKRQDYMNTAPQMIIALLRQLVGMVGVRPNDITVCDTLAYLVHEYYDILHAEFPEVEYARLRRQVRPHPGQCRRPCRSTGVAARRARRRISLPTCFAEADYLVNFATLKAHVATGVTLCGKNHFGSLVRWPVQEGFHDMHRHSFRKATRNYREQVDLMGHAHLGGKTVLYLIDGLFSGKHPIDPVPRRMTSAPFAGQWAASLLASQDPVAIDSVGFDFLWTEYDDFPRMPGVDDYLHEAALARDPPSGTFYDPDHADPKSVWRASAFTNTGTTPTRRSTRATSAPAKASSSSPSNPTPDLWTAAACRAQGVRYPAAALSSARLKITSGPGEFHRRRKSR